MHEVLVKRLGGLSLPRKSVVRLTDRPDMTLDVDRGRKTTIQHVTKKRAWHDLNKILLTITLRGTVVEWLGPLVHDAEGAGR